MSRCRTALVASLIWVVVPSDLAGQEVRAAIISESYGFDQPIPLDASRSIDGLAELSIPVVVGFQLTERSHLVVSGGFATLRTRDDSDDDAVSLSTILDTEVRYSYELLPRRLTALVSGVLPSGRSPYDRAELSLLQLATNDALGISTVAFGAGAALAVGLAGAVPWGDMAASAAATYTARGSYDFLVDAPGALDPGGEFRLRLGVEGPLPGTGFLRVAAIVAHRGEDTLGATAWGSSDLWSGYVAYDHGVGDSSGSVYLYDAYRTATAVEDGLVVPRSNTFALGGRWRFPVRDGDAVTPRMEYRMWSAEPFRAPDTLEQLGSTFRVGLEYAIDFGNGLALVFDAEGLFGEIATPISAVSALTSGARLGIHFERGG